MVLVSFEWQGDNNISIIRSSKHHKSSHYRILLWSVIITGYYGQLYFSTWSMVRNSRHRFWVIIIVILIYICHFITLLFILLKVLIQRFFNFFNGLQLANWKSRFHTFPAKLKFESRNPIIGARYTRALIQINADPKWTPKIQIASTR